jgi:hypothetical protein
MDTEERKRQEERIRDYDCAEKSIQELNEAIGVIQRGIQDFGLRSMTVKDWYFEKIIGRVNFEKVAPEILVILEHERDRQLAEGEKI